MKLSLAIFQPNAQASLESIVECEKIGVLNVWVPSMPLGFDPITLLAAAAVRTKTIQLGTGIAINYPKHPIAMATEAFVLGELAPGRIRLGLGPSHPFIIEGMYGLPFGKPVQYMREYVAILRQMLWEGHVDFDGEYFHAHGAPFLPMNPPKISLPLAGIRKAMFKLSGEIGDGVLTGWAPLPYVLAVAKPALEESASVVNRPIPPIIASLSIIPHSDRVVAKEVAQATLAPYLQASAYQDMFAQAGHFVAETGLTDALFDEIFIYGTPNQISERIEQVMSLGVDELMCRVEPVENPIVEFMTVAKIIAQLS